LHPFHDTDAVGLDPAFVPEARSVDIEVEACSFGDTHVTVNGKTSRRVRELKAECLRAKNRTISCQCRRLSFETSTLEVLSL
jgi:hypothetical protein